MKCALNTRGELNSPTHSPAISTNSLSQFEHISALSAALVVHALQLVEHLVHDPVADPLLYFILYVAEHVSHVTLLLALEHVSQPVEHSRNRDIRIIKYAGTLAKSDQTWGMLSPKLFAIYVDQLSEQLESSKVGCHINKQYMNHLFYAADAVLLSPTVDALQKLIDICQGFARKEVRYITLKSRNVLHLSLIPWVTYIPQMPT